jgi:hypothetical protein
MFHFDLLSQPNGSFYRISEQLYHLAFEARRSERERRETVTCGGEREECPSGAGIHRQESNDIRGVELFGANGTDGASRGAS